MISFIEIEQKDLLKMSKNTCSLIAIVRDLNFATFMGIPSKLYSIVENGVCVGVLYQTHDFQEEKNIATLFSMSQNAISALESKLIGTTTMVCPPLLTLKGMSYLDGGFYERNGNIRKVRCSSRIRIMQMKSLMQEKELISNLSLPTNDIDKYISWLDQNTAKYVAFEKDKIVSILCILLEPLNIVSFHWDSSDTGENLTELLNYCYAKYNNIIALAPQEKDAFLFQQGFLRKADWRLFYNEL